MRNLLIVCSILFFATTLAAQMIHSSFVVGGYTRVFETYLPLGWSVSNHLPVVIDLHYLGADGRDEDSLTQFNPIADTARFVVCHPSGLGTDWGVGQSAPYHNGLGDIEFIDQMIDTLYTRYGIDLERVYVTGMGQGGFMAQHLACKLGSRIAAIATVGACIADSTAFFCQGTRPMPMMMIDGTADSVVPFYAGLPGVWPSIPDLVAFWRTRNGCAGVEVSQTLPDLVQEGSTIITHLWECGTSSQVLQYEVVNGGFAWPGATRDLGSGGNRNLDINASVHIWEFFKQFDLNGLTVVDAANAGSELHIETYPNPATDILHVSISHGQIGDVKIHDLQGRLLQVPMVQTNAKDLEMDLRALPSSIYLLQVGTITKRVIVMR